MLKQFTLHPRFLFEHSLIQILRQEGFQPLRVTGFCAKFFPCHSFLNHQQTCWIRAPTTSSHSYFQISVARGRLAHAHQPMSVHACTAPHNMIIINQRTVIGHPGWCLCCHDDISESDRTPLSLSAREGALACCGIKSF